MSIQPDFRDPVVAALTELDDPCDFWAAERFCEHPMHASSYTNFHVGRAAIMECNLCGAEWEKDVS